MTIRSTVQAPSFLRQQPKSQLDASFMSHSSGAVSSETSASLNRGQFQPHFGMHSPRMSTPHHPSISSAYGAGELDGGGRRRPQHKAPNKEHSGEQESTPNTTQTDGSLRDPQSNTGSPSKLVNKDKTSATPGKVWVPTLPDKPHEEAWIENFGIGSTRHKVWAIESSVLDENGCIETLFYDPSKTPNPWLTNTQYSKRLRNLRKTPTLPNPAPVKETKKRVIVELQKAWVPDLPEKPDPNAKQEVFGRCRHGIDTQHSVWTLDNAAKNQKTGKTEKGYYNPSNGGMHWLSSKEYSKSISDLRAQKTPTEDGGGSKKAARLCQEMDTRVIDTTTRQELDLKTFYAQNAQRKREGQPQHRFVKAADDLASTIHNTGLTTPVFTAVSSPSRSQGSPLTDTAASNGNSPHSEAQQHQSIKSVEPQGAYPLQQLSKLNTQPTEFMRDRSPLSPTEDLISFHNDFDDFNFSAYSNTASAFSSAFSNPSRYGFFDNTNLELSKHKAASPAQDRESPSFIQDTTSPFAVSNFPQTGFFTEMPHNGLSMLPSPIPDSAYNPGFPGFEWPPSLPTNDNFALNEASHSRESSQNPGKKH